MKNGTRRSSGNKRRKPKLSMQYLVGAYASLRFRERRQVKMLANQRGVSVEELLVELARIGLKKMFPAEGQAELLAALPAIPPRMPERRKAD